MLRSGEQVFLDDVTVAQAEEALGVSIVPESGRRRLLDAMLGLDGPDLSLVRSGRRRGVLLL